MDDTLVAFSKGLGAFNVKNDASFIHKPRSEWTELQKKLDREVMDCMNTPDFFLELPINDGALKLWGISNHLGSTNILTAYPQTTKDIDRVKYEKLIWCQENLPSYDLSINNFICCAREDKIKYATSCTEMWDSKYTCTRETFSSNVLVDDLPANISAWEKAGGLGVLFKNSEQAIDDLKNVFNRT